MCVVVAVSFSCQIELNVKQTHSESTCLIKNKCVCRTCLSGYFSLCKRKKKNWNDVLSPVKLRNIRVWLPKASCSYVGDVVTFISGRGYKDLFFSVKRSTSTILWELWKQCWVPTVTRQKPRNDWKSADEPLADQVIIRKESKSYRMTGIENLKTYGKSFLSARAVRKGGGRATVGEANVKPQTSTSCVFHSGYKVFLQQIFFIERYSTQT